MLLKVSEAAEILRVSPRQVRNMINDGKLSVISLTDTPRGDRLEESEVNEFIARSRTVRRVKGKKKCQSTYAAKSGGASLASMEKELDALLGQPRNVKH